MNVSSLSPTVLVFNPYQMRGDSNAFRSRSLRQSRGIVREILSWRFNIDCFGLESGDVVESGGQD